MDKTTKDMIEVSIISIGTIIIVYAIVQFGLNKVGA
jgi:hypothetical protein